MSIKNPMCYPFITSGSLQSWRVQYVGFVLLQSKYIATFLTEELQSSFMRNKRGKFVELAEKRVNRLLKDIRLIGNLSNRSNYDFTDEDVRKVFSAIENEVRQARKRFESSGNSTETTFKL